jgi:hypothetical protein
MANNILFGNCDKHIIKVRVQELNRGPQGVPGPAGRDGVVQYTAGNGIEISDENVISATGTGAVWGAITGVLSNQADLNVMLSTKASNDAVREAQNTANQAVSTANAAQTAAANANAGVAGLSNYLTLNKTEYTASDFEVVSGPGTIDPGVKLWVEKNSDGTVCRIYGAIQMDNASSSGRTTIRIKADTGLRPTADYTITSAGIVASVSSYGIANANITITTTGIVEISGAHDPGIFYYRIFPCLEFLQPYNAN